MKLDDLPLFSQQTQKVEPKKTDIAKSECFTVSELTAKIRETLEPVFTSIWVKGEVSNFRPASSGHVYFSLKDAGSTLPVACFNWNNRRKKSPFNLEDGMEILCHGKITVYSPRGSYQLIADQLEPVGAGALQLAFEQLKTKLNQEGLFDIKRKRALPLFPTRLVVITSPSGAAIQDILNILKRRSPWLNVLVLAAFVQGDSASAQLINALEIANRFQLGDIIIFARGGGSIEDLWCFNDENLARAISSSQIPVVSAVGHEIDFTISDFVSDVRAPTPSAAAEIITTYWVDAAKRMSEYQSNMQKSILRSVEFKKTLLSHISARVISPKDKLREQAQRADELYLKLCQAMQIKIERRKNSFYQLISKMEALSPLKVLERGFTLVKDAKEQLIRSANDIKTGMELKVIFYDGQRRVKAL